MLVENLFHQRREVLKDNLFVKDFVKGAIV